MKYTIDPLTSRLQIIVTDKEKMDLSEASKFFNNDKAMNYLTNNMVSDSELNHADCKEFTSIAIIDNEKITTLELIDTNGNILFLFDLPNE
jgi:hypothetical protein